MLDVQPDECLGDTVYDGQKKRCGGGYPIILHRKEEGTVTDGPKVPTQSPKLTSATNNLKYLPLDFLLERSTPLVSTKQQEKTGRKLRSR
jgi:hypothetical protein